MAKTLTSMKNPPQEKSKAEVMYPSMSDAPEYPYGLRLYLEEQQIRQLGLTMPKVGQSMTLEARVEVCTTAEHDSHEGGKSRSVGLQITALAVE